MELSDLIRILEDLAPPAYAEPWDNVGLLVGDPRQPVSRAMLTIDYTADVAAEAAIARCEAVVAYHPPIFHPLKRLTARAGGSLVFDAIRRGVALYSPHTALDVADGGTNDMLADALGLQDRQPLRPAAPAGSQYKLVTFVPQDAMERVSRAIFAAGAGRIGKYSQCSFFSPGTGTFFGEEGSNPAVGRSGQLEQAAELRLETILPIARAAEVVRALQESHPYEEPAFDLLPLAADPIRGARGMGRIGILPPTARHDLLARIKQQLGITHLLVAGPIEGTVTTAACCAGACGDLLDDALKAGAGLYLTGELRHHDALRAAAAGLTVVCTLHSHSERAILRRLADSLRQRLPDLQVLLSTADHDPFAIL